MKLLVLGLGTAAVASAIHLDVKIAKSLLRQKRDNEGIFEEAQQGNFERECNQEICSFEEAREVYENDDEARKAFNEKTKQCEKQLCNAQNTQECVNNWGGYTCRCKAGFGGKHCDDDIDECAIDGFCGTGSCENTHGSFMCQCDSFWNGTKCEIDIDECALNEQICGDNGSCNNIENGYECVCNLGWSGSHCELDVDECESGEQLCSGDKVCLNNVGSYTCVCPNGKVTNEDSDECTVDFDECSLNPCPVGLVCANEDNGYVCQCSDRGCLLDVEEPGLVETTEELVEYNEFATTQSNVEHDVSMFDISDAKTTMRNDDVTEDSNDDYDDGYNYDV